MCGRSLSSYLRCTSTIETEGLLSKHAKTVAFQTRLVSSEDITHRPNTYVSCSQTKQFLSVSVEDAINIFLR